MDTGIVLVSDLTVKPGQGPALQALVAEMSADAQAHEPGTLAYEWHVSADGQRCHVYERYASPAAATAHLATFGAKYASRFFAALVPGHFICIGTPDAALRAALAAGSPDYLEPMGGFRRPPA